jgi:hypothetical protein
MKKLLTLLIPALIGCSPSTKETPSTETVPVDSATDTTAPADVTWDYETLYGNYSLESSTGNFRASLALEPRGNELAFTLVSRKGSCEGDLSGVIMMMNHNEHFDTGYSMEESCKLEFIFRYQEDLVDVKEIHLCTAHDPACGFEGTYRKIKD